ncbi:hypothetical protein CP082626L3_0637B, partial [Chlamydia psittaci 08-2626_L3]
LLILHCL